MIGDILVGLGFDDSCAVISFEQHLGKSLSRDILMRGLSSTPYLPFGFIVNNVRRINDL